MNKKELWREESNNPFICGEDLLCKFDDRLIDLRKLDPNSSSAHHASIDPAVFALLQHYRLETKFANSVPSLLYCVSLLNIYVYYAFR